MSRHHLRSPPCPENVAEFLADREGLVGGARDRFRRLLHEYGGFREIAPRRRWPAMTVLSSLLTLGGFVVDRPLVWSDRLLWVVYGILSAVLIWRVHRAERRDRHVDVETDWQAYCLFLRPVILSDHPGLLDRNSKGEGYESAQSMLRGLPMFRNLVYDQGPGLWWSAALGLWGGMVVLIVTHFTASDTSGGRTLAFPASGFVLGLASFLVWRRLIYLIAKSHFRLIDS